MDEVHYNGVEIYKGYRESFSKLSDLFRKYFDSKDAVEKNILKQQTEQLISSIQNNIAGVLNQNGIAYEITPAFSEYTDYYQMNWSFFKIKPTGGHWLNKWSEPRFFGHGLKVHGLLILDRALHAKG